MAPIFSIAAFIYPGADILDFSGPIEIYSTQPPPGQPTNFNVTTFSQQNPVAAEGGSLVLVPNASFADIEAKLEEYDILLIPGAHPGVLTKLIPSEDGQAIAALIKKFASLKPRDGTGSRILQSVCTGALFLAASGILANRTVTTYYMAYDTLKTIADQVAGGESNVNVVKKRWVDAGTMEAGARIVMAGCVTSGIDASLWVVESLVGKERAEWVAEIVEFERRGEGAWSV